MDNSFAWVTAEYKLNRHDLYRISIAEGFTYIQRHYKAAKKEFSAESLPEDIQYLLQQVQKKFSMFFSGFQKFVGNQVSSLIQHNFSRENS